MNKSDRLTIVGIIIIWAIALVLAFAAEGRVSAQDTPITVCRDPRVDVVRLEFRNIPLSYFVWNSDSPSWTYWAGGAAMDTEKGVLITDALEVDTDGYLAGTAALVVYGDEPFTLVGDVNTLLCDSEPVGVPAPVDTCPAWAVDGATGGKVCLWSLPKATS